MIPLGVAFHGERLLVRIAFTLGYVFKNGYVGGFPGGPVVKNLPASAGYTCSIPLASGQLSLSNATTELASHNY